MGRGPLTDGTFLVTDAGGEILRFDAAGAFVGPFEWNVDEIPHDALGFGLMVDGAGNLYLQDYETDRQWIVGPDGALLAAWGDTGSGPGQSPPPTTSPSTPQAVPSTSPTPTTASKSSTSTTRSPRLRAERGLHDVTNINIARLAGRPVAFAGRSGYRSRRRHHRYDHPGVRRRLADLPGQSGAHGGGDQRRPDRRADRAVGVPDRRAGARRGCSGRRHRVHRQR